MSNQVGKWTNADRPVLRQTKRISAFTGCLAQITSLHSEHSPGTTLCFQPWWTGLTFTESAARDPHRGRLPSAMQLCWSTSRLICGGVYCPVLVFLVSFTWTCLLRGQVQAHKTHTDILECSRCYINKGDFYVGIWHFISIYKKLVCRKVRMFSDIVSAVNEP